VDVAERVREGSSRLRSLIQKDLAQRKILLSHLMARVVSPKDRLREQAQRVDDLALRLERAVQFRLERRRAALQQVMGKLDALSPLKVLERGYTLIRVPGDLGQVVKSAHQVSSGEELEITFYDGQRVVRAN